MAPLRHHHPGLGVPGQFLDFPDIAVGANSLYVTTNIFAPNGQFGRAAVCAFPIASIGRGQVTAQPFLSSDLNSFRVAQNCGRGRFSPPIRTPARSTFSPGTRPGDARPAPGRGGTLDLRERLPSRTPDGRSWLDRADPRITGATLAGSDLYFAWGVNAGSNRRPQPFIQIAKIDANDLTLLENINVFDPEFRDLLRRAVDQCRR